MMDSDVRRRCSAWAREVDLSPIGTSGSYRGYLLIEAPLAWPKDIVEVPALVSLASRLSSLNIRLQGLVPSSPKADPTGLRMILHAPSEEGGGFTGYRRFETTAGDSLEASLHRLLAPARDHGHNLASSHTHVLVCTHGHRDVCC